MKALTIILTLLVTPAAAQSTLPRTVPFNDASGQQVGTATFSGNHIYLRDLEGKHIVTVVLEKDGSRTMLDPSGNVLDRQANPKSPPK
jgi:hypothetical protein